MKKSSPARAALLLGAILCGLFACARGGTDEIDPTTSFGSNFPTPPGACIDTTCPAPFATCSGRAGPCTTDLSNDVDHCGDCSTPCLQTTEDSHGTYLCSSGQCKIACDAYQADCDANIDDGCETSTYSDTQNCGGCGVACTDLCWKGACGCPKGFTQCGLSCVQLQSDGLNCGSCGTLCVAPETSGDPRWICGAKVQPTNTEWTCATSACSLLCKPGFEDCNASFCGDGCETDVLHDAKNCGACGKTCGSGQFCNNGTCSCPLGTRFCSGECVDVRNDAANCGSCGARCEGPSTSRAGRVVTGGPLCTDGQCRYACKPGYADCDSSIENGCEVNLNTNQNHCGACGTTCNVAGGQPCFKGTCLTKECGPAPVPR